MRVPINYDGKVYYVIYKEEQGLVTNFNIVDDMYIEAHESDYNAVLSEFIKTLKFENLDGKQILSWIRKVRKVDRKGTEDKGCFGVKLLCEKYMEVHGGTYARDDISQTYMSCLRSMGRPTEAIEFYDKTLALCGKSFGRNIYALTVLAAAYCDICKPVEAANALKQAESVLGFCSREMAAVWGRLRKEYGSI